MTLQRDDSARVLAESCTMTDGLRLEVRARDDALRQMQDAAGRREHATIETTATLLKRIAELERRTAGLAGKK